MANYINQMILLCVNVDDLMDMTILLNKQCRIVLNDLSKALNSHLFLVLMLQPPSKGESHPY